MKVLMLPDLAHIGQGSSGIARVVQAYYKYLPDYGIELVDATSDSYDLKAVHVGMTGADVDVCHCHGLNFTAEYKYPEIFWKQNARIIEAIRHARAITVPSSWVAETFQRDMRFTPHVVPHGIDWDDWQHNEKAQDFVLWNKNRYDPVCETETLVELAKRAIGTTFVATFGARYEGNPRNLEVIKVQPFPKMKRIVQGCKIYLSTAKETFGIGILEAMAAGKPVLAFAWGGALDLVHHGVTGYLAQPGNLDDLQQGLEFCKKHTKELGEAGREAAKRWTWQAVCEQVAQIYRDALKPQPPTAAIVIPCYNKEGTVGTAVRSACNQTYKPLEKIIVVDDGSEHPEAIEAAVFQAANGDRRVSLIRQKNQGVAAARNAGIKLVVNCKYICCLDADDAIAPQFLEKPIAALEADPSLGIASTGMRVLWPKHTTENANEPDFDQQVRKKNQIPTCCVFRRDAWLRTGGYKNRFCWKGAGSEDANLWLRVGSIGYGMKLADPRPLFLYAANQGHTADPDYVEPDWTSGLPWVKDRKHPFASIASPERSSHPVHSYDRPIVSVVIPVGSGHEKHVTDALDSLEAQGFRDWEAIVVDDTGKEVSFTTELLESYPYIRTVTTEGKRGAGFARNRGAELARAPLLFFFDADDWLFPDCLSDLVKAFQTCEEPTGIYGFYRELTNKENEERLAQLHREKRLLQHDPETNWALISYESAKFDLARAQRQPDFDHPYLWCSIGGVLIPTSWHHEIGGFDEQMESYEDYDYFVRLARAGHCFHRIQKLLLLYRSSAGGRRLVGLKNRQKLLEYMQEKYSKEASPVKRRGCSGCGERGEERPPAPAAKPRRFKDVQQPARQDFVECTYKHPNRGTHHVFGPHTFPTQITENMVAVEGGWKIRYGYFGGGSRMWAHVEDVKEAPNWFVPISESDVHRITPPQPVPPPPPSPREQPQLGQGTVAAALEQRVLAELRRYEQGEQAESPEAEQPEQAPVEVKVAEPVVFAFDPGSLPGVGEEAAAEMLADGLDSYEKIGSKTVAELMKYPNIGQMRAEAILAFVASMKEVQL